MPLPPERPCPSSTRSYRYALGCCSGLDPEVLANRCMLQNYHTKAALIILHSRVELPPSFAKGSDTPKVNRWVCFHALESINAWFWADNVFSLTSSSTTLMSPGNNYEHGEHAMPPRTGRHLSLSKRTSTRMASPITKVSWFWMKVGRGGMFWIRLPRSEALTP